MIPDIDIKFYYLEFIKEINNNIKKAEEELKHYNTVRNKFYNNIKDNVEIINNYINIDINDENIILNLDYKSTADKIIKIIYRNDNRNIKITLSHFLNYIKSVKNIYATNQTILVLYKNKDISLKDYKLIIKKFYTAVGKCLLEGYAYQFQEGLGDLVINRWKIKSDKPVIDYTASKRNKQRILDNGGELYDEEQAKICKLRGIKYKGEDYRVYRKNSHYYQFALVNSKYERANVTLDHKKYISKPLKHKTQEEIAEQCKSLEDIYNLDCDIHHKLGILLKFEPMSYLNFIRNAEQEKCYIGAHNSKNRQRFQS